MATRAPRRLAGAALSVAAVFGCAAGVPVAPPSGLLFAYQSAPLETNFEETRIGAKTGMAKVHFLREPFFTNLPLVTWGDASIEAAAREGGIQTVHYADYELLSVLGIYVQMTVEVSGD